MINRLIETNNQVEVQEMTFSIDVPGRHICSTWDEATNNGGVEFGAVVIGAGMFGAYCAEKLYRNSNLRVLLLDAGSYLVSEHVQNLSRIGLNAAPATQVSSNSQDPGTRARVWGSPWRSQVPFPGLAYCVGGRSLYWGGWAPRLTPRDLAQWPVEVATFLQTASGVGDSYEETERETGTFDTTDYISGPLYQELDAKFKAVMASVPPAQPSLGRVTFSVTLLTPKTTVLPTDIRSATPLARQNHQHFPVVLLLHGIGF